MSLKGQRKNNPAWRKTSKGGYEKVSKQNTHMINTLPIMSHEQKTDKFTAKQKAAVNEVATEWPIEDEFWTSPEAQKLPEEYYTGDNLTKNAGELERAYFNFQSRIGWEEEIQGELQEPEIPDYIEDVGYAEIFTEEYLENCRNYGRPIRSRVRNVWFDTANDRVIKQFTDSEGEIAAMNEITISNEPEKNDIVMAKTEPYKSLCISSEMVHEFLTREDPRMPKWSDFVDCGQVGVTKDGRVVAYDL